jgi:hypothetical protein
VSDVLRALAGPLDLAEETLLAGALRDLLAWQVDLRRFPALVAAPDGLPIVSLYTDGRLVGCYGSDEGSPGERLARAFVQALGDARFGGVTKEARRRLTAQVSYLHSLRRASLEGATAALEVGTHGVALHMPSNSAMLLPDVAIEHALGPSELLDALSTKAGVPRDAWPADALSTFETTSVVARLDDPAVEDADPVTSAARWLADRVRPDGSVEFGFDAATNEGVSAPPMYHGRVAILVRALFAQGTGRGAAVKARRVLEADLRRAAAGDLPPHFPTSRALAAGTFALASLAGLDCDDKLLELARAPELAREPWYAAQVVTALGRRADASLFRACLDDLARSAWAPWTLSAAVARGDAEAIAMTKRALLSTIRETAPHSGGVGPSVPEIARTAAAVEALRTCAETPSEHDAIRRARAFLFRQQLSCARYARARDPRRVDGAFPISPVRHFLQIDVTAHALLAVVPDTTPFVR